MVFCVVLCFEFVCTSYIGDGGDPQNGGDRGCKGAMTALAFALVHLGPDFAVALVYGALTGWVSIKTGNMWAAVIMHAVANLSLGLFIISTQWWGLW